MKRSSSANFLLRNWKAVDPDCDWSTTGTPALPIRERRPRSGDHIPYRCIRISAFENRVQETGDRLQGIHCGCHEDPEAKDY